jgi:hypothetical protein
MLIYVIPNIAVPNTEYVCDSQATIDAIPVNKKTGQPIISPLLCSVGTETEANTMLASNQKAWLAQQADLFTVNLQTTVESGVVWTVVDLSTQPSNTDYQYFVLDPATGLYTEAIGLDAANSLFAQTQQTYLVFTNMNAYITMTSWT